jgi:flagellar motor switch protein FliM
MRRRLDYGLFFLQLVLPEQRVRVSQILSLEPGDVLKLNCSLGEATHLLVSGKVLFNAHPVRMMNRRAAQVDGRVRSLDTVQKESA